MSLAIIQTGGKQYVLKPNKVLRVEKLPGEAGSDVVFDSVLLTASEDGSSFQIGSPFIEDAKVAGKILSQGRAKKVRVIKFKHKVRYKRTRGHRQHYTEVKILSLTSEKRT